MNWITIQGFHYNLDHVVCFVWEDETLAILCDDGHEADTFPDPDKAWYNKMRSRVSLLPVE